MDEIKKEYPEGKGVIEMVLVKMLNERRSWADYQAIGQALWNIRFHADQMKKEREYLTGDHGCEADTCDNRPPSLSGLDPK